MSEPTLPEIRELANWPGYGYDADGEFWSRRWVRRKSLTCLGEWKRLKGYFHPKVRYKTVNLSKDGKQKVCYVHRLIAESQYGPCPLGMECCHNDGNIRNNRPTNLRWDTKVGNFADKVAHGTTSRGEKSSCCKISTKGVESMRAFMAEGWSQSFIAKLFGCTQTLVSLIKRGKTRKWG